MCSSATALPSCWPGLALFLRGSLPFLAGAPYQVPVTAVVLSAWYGGRGPGLFALLIYATANLYFFIPPVHSFELHPDFAFVFFTFLALCLLQKITEVLALTEHELRSHDIVLRTELDRTLPRVGGIGSSCSRCCST